MTDERNELTAEGIEHYKKLIDDMSQMEMARLHRFAPGESIYFDKSTPVQQYFSDRFKALGGMTPAISKAIGWNT